MTEKEIQNRSMTEVPFLSCNGVYRYFFHNFGHLLALHQTFRWFICMWCLVLSKENECKCRSEEWTVGGVGSETSRVHTFFRQCLLTLVNCANVSTTFLLGCTNDHVYTWLAFNPPPSLVSSLELKGFPWSCRVSAVPRLKLGTFLCISHARHIWHSWLLSLFEHTFCMVDQNWANAWHLAEWAPFEHI